MCARFVGLAKSHWPMTSYRPNFITNTRSALVAAAAAAATTLLHGVNVLGGGGTRVIAPGDFRIAFARFSRNDTMTCWVEKKIVKYKTSKQQQQQRIRDNRIRAAPSCGVRAINLHAYLYTLNEFLQLSFRTKTRVNIKTDRKKYNKKD